MADTTRDDGVVATVVAHLDRLITEFNQSRDTSDVGLIQAQARLAQLSLEINKSKIDHWAKIWKVDPDLSSPMLLTLWGSEGLDAVRSRLQACNQSIEKMRVSTGRELESETKVESPLNDLKQKWATLRRRASKPRDSPIPRSAEARQHLARVSDLRHDIAWLNTKVDELCTVSNMAFEATQRSPTRLLNFDIDDSESLLDTVKKSRAGAIALHQYCKDWETDACLDTDLLHLNSDLSKEPGTHVKFHVFRLNNAERRFEDMELVTHEVDGGRCRVCQNIFDDGKIVPISSPESIPSQQTSSADIRSSRETRQFQFQEVQNRQQDWSTSSVPVSRCLSKVQIGQDTVTKRGRSLSLVDRIRLAYQFSHCALFLMDTPWLSGLDDHSVRVLNTSSHVSKYVLQKRPKDLIIDFDTYDMVSRGPSDVFKVGVMLVEIAVGNSLDYTDDEVSCEPILLLPAVERHMGPQYRDAAAFCLSRGRIRYPKVEIAERERDNFLKEYYIETVQRLHNLLLGLQSLDDDSDSQDTP